MQLLTKWCCVHLLIFYWVLWGSLTLHWSSAGLFFATISYLVHALHWSRQLLEDSHESLHPFHRYPHSLGLLCHSDHPLLHRLANIPTLHSLSNNGWLAIFSCYSTLRMSIFWRTSSLATVCAWQWTSPAHSFFCRLLHQALPFVAIAYLLSLAASSSSVLSAYISRDSLLVVP